MFHIYFAVYGKLVNTLGNQSNSLRGGDEKRQGTLNKDKQ
jgi:hypothetical protein